MEYTHNPWPSIPNIPINRACQGRINNFIKSQKGTSLQQTLNIPIEILNIKLTDVSFTYISFNITFKKNMYY